MVVFMRQVGTTIKAALVGRRFAMNGVGVQDPTNRFGLKPLGRPFRFPYGSEFLLCPEYGYPITARVLGGRVS